MSEEFCCPILKLRKINKTLIVFLLCFSFTSQITVRHTWIFYIPNKSFTTVDVSFWFQAACKQLLINYSPKHASLTPKSSNFVTINLFNQCKSWYISSSVQYSIMIRSPMSIGHESDSSEWRMMHDWEYRRFGVCRSINAIISRRLLHFLTIKWAGGWLNQLDRIGCLNSSWMLNQRPMNDILCIGSRLYMYTPMTLGDTSHL